jgi:hypothetical protein
MAQHKVADDEQYPHWGRLALNADSGYSDLRFAKSCFYHFVAASLKGMYSSYSPQHPST